MEHVLSWVQNLSSVLKCRVPRGSYYPHCSDMLEQVRGKNWQGPPISTQPDRHPVVSWEYNPLISRCPQFPLMRAWKLLSYWVGTCEEHEIRREILFLVRFSLWHGSVCMCKSSFTVEIVKKKKKRCIFFAISDISSVSWGVPFLVGLSGVRKCSWHAKRTIQWWRW